jgi:restriction system protein
MDKGVEMAEITRERAGEMVRAAFEVLMKNPEGLPAREVIQRIGEMLVLTDDEKSDYPNTPGTRKFDKRVRFSTISPVKAGWMIKSNGQWIITAEGTEAYTQFPEPGDFMREASRLYRSWKSAQPLSEPEEIEGEDIDSAISTTLEVALESARAGIEEYLANMPPYEFQELVAGLLRAMGYHVPWVAPPGRDGGVDILAFTDPIGATGPRIKVQVKRQTSSKIGVEGLRSFLAVLGSQDTGVFVSLGGFSSDAESESRAQDNRRLLLVDRDRLVQMWIDNYPRLTERDKSRLPLQPVYFLSPND